MELKKEQRWWGSWCIRNREKKKTATKIHLQFGHANKEKRLVEKVYGKRGRSI